MNITIEALQKNGWKSRDLNGGVMSEHWKYLSGKQEKLVESGKRFEFDCARVVVRFGEYKNVNRPIVYLSLGSSSIPLFHIDDMVKLKKLCNMLYQDEINIMEFIRRSS